MLKTRAKSRIQPPKPASPDPTLLAGLRPANASGRTAGIPARIAEQIREMIVRGALSPGVHLGQMELAEQFEASRVPVREALKLLAAEGLLIHDPNRGFFVATLSSDEARQLYRMRHLIEFELLSTVEWPSPPQIKAFQAMLDELEELLAKGDRTAWNVRHREFHLAIFNLSPQKILVREVLRLWTLTDRYRSLLPSPRARAGARGSEDERDLVDALAKQDRQRLLAAFEEDRTRVEQMLLSLLDSRAL
jgi:DNA-binding GntR family transcriptional regulator